VKKIEIIFNGIKEKVPENTSISDLIRLSDEKESDLIVELNNKFVFSQTYTSTILSDGDKIEFINPDFGG